jgi:spermidine synthase
MRPLRFYTGVFLVSFSILMLEIIQTRILSVVVWYHLAFLVISLAMFGLTAGAVWVYLRAARFTEKTLSYDLAYFSSIGALTTAICLAIQMTLAPVISRFATTVWMWTELALCLSVPFFFCGVVVSLALTRSPFMVARVYGVDLLGAAMGCLGALALLNLTDGPSAVLWVSAVMAAAALSFDLSGIGNLPEKMPPLNWLVRHRWLICLFLVFCALINPLTEHGLQPLAVKGKFEFPESYLFRQWNSFSRVVVGPLTRGRPYLWGPSPKIFQQRWITEQTDLNIDGDAGSTAYRFTGKFDEVGFLKYDITNLAYFLPGREKAVIIGVGGGRDVLSAALFGRKEITGVELNPIFVHLLTEEPGFVKFTNLSALPGVRFVVDEGRSWLARRDDFFDLIQMSLVDTWAATGAGAFTLSENGLYTVEAWKIFLHRLSATGVFTVSRWYDPTVPDETGRLVSLAMATLFEMGVSEPRRHVFLAAQREVATLVLSKSPLAPSDVEALEKAAAEYQHDVLITPRSVPASFTLLRIMSAADRGALDAFTSSLEFDLTPPTDDRPFFFNQLTLSRPLQALAYAQTVVGRQSSGGGVRRGNLVATGTLVILFVITLLLVVATVIIPLRFALIDVGRPLVIKGTLYFILIGAGFMLVEIGLLQRMSVFLGHPVYSLSVLLFTLILATGLGSFMSERLPLNVRRRMITWGVLTFTYLIALPFALNQLFGAFSNAALPSRIALCVMSITPAGLLLGFGFPTGMRLITLIDPKPTPWFWGINGAAGVLASIGAIALSLALGITATMTLGALCYVLVIPTSLALLQKESAGLAKRKSKRP